MCVRELFTVVLAECGNHCVRGDGLLLESVFTNVCTYIVQTAIV